MKKSPRFLNLVLVFVFVFGGLGVTAKPAQAAASDLFFSEYIEGSSYNKALEIYNGTEAAVDLSQYSIERYSNGSSTVTDSHTLSGTLESGDVFVIANSGAGDAILAVADLTDGVINFNGDDAMVLRKGTKVVDVIGRIGEDPGSKWGTEPITTVEHTLVRKPIICSGDTDGTDAFDPATEWEGYAQDTFTYLGSHTSTCLAPVETAPSVLSTSPSDGAMNIALDSNISITFDEAVTVTGDWFEITCDSSGIHTADVTDNDPEFILDPDIDFDSLETCTVTVYADAVTDDDVDDETYDQMEVDYTFSFTTLEACGAAYTPIYDIQGNAWSTPLSGTEVSTEGIVVGDFQVGGKDGFFIQDALGDSDTNTSDGIFVYAPSAVDVDMGDHVRVNGTATEFYDLTQIGSVNQILVCQEDAGLPEPTELTLPVGSTFDFERHEGMYVTMPQDLVISEYFNFDRFGEIVLTSERFMQYTAINDPDPVGNDAYLDDYLLNSITLDDGRTNQNPDPARHPNGDPFTLDNRFRGGDLVTDVTGVIDYSFDLYRLQPTQGAKYTPVNFRTGAPDIIEGDLKVASFNVLNYFLTLGDRGADNAEELARQRAKILSAMEVIDADIFGLVEIENDSGAAVADLVAGLNDIFGAGTYSYINTGVIGTDAIKVALLYKPGSITPVGGFKILDSSVDPRFIDSKNRPVLAQVFIDHHTGETFTVAVNHLKSKGSECDALGDPDLGDGAGNCNLTRLAAAEAMVDWLADDFYFPESDKHLIIGDLNAYDKEDPIDAIKAGPDDDLGSDDDYVDMIYQLLGENAYGYLFDGKLGYLDYALPNKALEPYVIDLTIWHINADEPDLIDYDTSFKKDAQDAIYAEDPYRSSDHDPVIITLTFDEPVVPVDILPGGCPNPVNVKDKGVIPVAILGTADFDAALINPETILLEGVSPIRWSLEDVAAPYFPYTGKTDSMDCVAAGPDGYLDLVLQFDTQEIITKLGEIVDGDVIVLTLTGNLTPDFWNIPFSGEDVITILSKGKP